MRKNNILTMSLLLIIAAMGWSCSPSDDVETDSISFEEGNVTDYVLTDDFEMSDVEQLADCAAKMEDMRLQYMKGMSNGWAGDLFSGIGDKSDPSRMYDIFAQMLDNMDSYIDAYDALDESAILDNPNTRSTKLDAFLFAAALRQVALDRKETVLDLLYETKIMSNSKLQEQMFRDLPEKWKKGAKSAREWFQNLQAGEYNSLCPALHTYWVTQGASESNAGSPLAMYSAKVLDEASKNPLWQDAHKIAKELYNQGVDLYVSTFDGVIGGFIGDADALADILKEGKELRDKIKKGTATEKDLKSFAFSMSTKWVSENLPDVGEAVGSDLVSDLQGDLYDWLVTNAQENLEDDQRPKDNNVSTLSIVNNLGYGEIAGAIIKDEKTGDVTFGMPDESGYITATVTPGIKTVTVITKKGKRCTQRISAKPERVKLDAAAKVKDPMLVLSRTKVKVDASFQYAEVGISTNIPFGRYKSDCDWIQAYRKGDEIIISVDKNESFEPRKGTVTVSMSSDKKTVDKTAVIQVEQEGSKDDYIIVKPDEWEVSAMGGDKEFIVEMRSEEYDDYGFYPIYPDYDDPKFEDWITVTKTSKGFKVSAKENKTNADREAKVRVYATYKSADDPEDYDGELITYLTVRQPIGETGTLEGEWFFEKSVFVNDKVDIHSVTFFNDNTYVERRYLTMRDGNSTNLKVSTHKVTVENKGTYSVKGDKIIFKNSDPKSNYSIYWNEDNEFQFTIVPAENPFKAVYEHPYSGYKMELVQPNGKKVRAMYKDLWHVDIVEEPLEINQLRIELKGDFEYFENGKTKVDYDIKSIELEIEKDDYTKQGNKIHIEKKNEKLDGLELSLETISLDIIDEVDKYGHGHYLLTSAKYYLKCDYSKYYIDCVRFEETKIEASNVEVGSISNESNSKPTGAKCSYSSTLTDNGNKMKEVKLIDNDEYYIRFWW